MKKLLFSFLVLFSFFLSAQHVMFAQTDWSDPMAFDWSHPTIRGYGELSDSLSSVYPDLDFYELNGTYFAIDSWADYYNWFTQKFWYRFKRPVAEYAAYYMIGDNQFMMEFVFNSYDFDKWETEHPEIRRNGSQLIFNTLIIDNTLVEQLDSDRLKSVAYKANDDDRLINNRSSTNSSGNQSNGRSGISGSSSSTGGTTNSGKSIGN